MKEVFYVNGVRLRFYVSVVSSTCIGPVELERIYVPESGKTLKKVWKHVLKRYSGKDNELESYDVLAYVEDESGDLHDMSMYWSYQYEEGLVEAGVIPF